MADQGSPNIVKIRELHLRCPRNTRIRVQVTSKSAIRTYNNSTGSGRFFSVTLRDDTGEIRCVAFNNKCDIFYNMLLANSYYVIQFFDIKPCNPRYSKSRDRLELTLNLNTRITLCEAEASADTSTSYDFVEIHSVASNDDNVLDLIGVCKDVDIIQNVDKKPYRRVNLVDDSCVRLESICLTVWGSETALLDNAKHQVVCLKRAHVNEYNGIKSLSSSGHLILNPDIPRARELRDWYRAKTENWTVIADAVRVRDRTSWCHAVVTQVYGGQCQLYYSCKQCKDKKMTLEDGDFVCNKCGGEESVTSILLKLQVADPSGMLDIAAFTEVAEHMLGTTVHQLSSLLKDDLAFGLVFDDLRFKSFMFNFDNFKTHTDTGKRIIPQAVVTGVRAVNYKQLNERILLNIPDVDCLRDTSEESQEYNY